MPLLKRLGLAGILLSIQLILLWTNAPGETLAEKETSCFRADSHWYASIVDNGYVSTIPPTAQNKEISNVAFFPAYPKLAALFKFLTGASTSAALVWTARLSAFVLWYFMVSALATSGLSNLSCAVLLIYLLSHPSAFFMSIGYSEATFMMFWMGYLYWIKNKWVSSLFGLLGNATRMTALGGSFISLLIYKKNSRTIQTLVMLMGTLSFFAYCQFKFGAWNLYQQTEAIGWGQSVDFFAIFKLKNWNEWIPGMYSAWGFGRSFASWLGAFCLALFPFWLWLLLKNNFTLPITMKRSFAGWALASSTWYVSVAATSNQQLSSFLRFSLPIEFFLVIGLVSLLARLSPPKHLKYLGLLLLIGLSAWRLVNQIRFIHDLTRDIWVA